MRSTCLAPEILKPRRRQLRVPDRMLNVAETKVSLDRSGIMSLVGQGITAGMPIPSVLRVHAESDIRYTQPRIISRNVHQKFAKILPAQEADKGPRRVLEPLNHVFAIFDPSLANPGRDIAHEIPIAPEKVGDDETAKRQPFGQDRSHQVRQEDRAR